MNSGIFDRLKVEAKVDDKIEFTDIAPWDEEQYVIKHGVVKFGITFPGCFEVHCTDGTKHLLYEIGNFLINE